MKKLGIVSVIAALAIAGIVACGCTSAASEESAQDNQTKSNEQVALDKEIAASNNSIVGEWAFCSNTAGNYSEQSYQVDTIVFAEDGTVNDYRYANSQEGSSRYKVAKVSWKPYVVAHAEIDGKEYSFYVEEASYFYYESDKLTYTDTFWAVSDDVIIGFYGNDGVTTLKYFIVGGDFASNCYFTYLGGRVE